MLKYQKYTEQELSILLREGDSFAFTEVYDRFFSSLYLHALRRLQDSDEAQDAVQDLFLTLWNNREILEFSNLKNYLFTAVRNKVLNIIAHKDVRTRYALGIPQEVNIETAITDHRLRERLLTELIDKEISQLPEKMRQVFEMSRKQHLSHKEIATQLGLTEQSVRSHIKNALKILRGKLGYTVYLLLFLEN